MMVTSVEKVPQKDVEVKGAEGVQIQWLVDRNAGADRFAMRRFELAKGGYTPEHAHDWEHEVLVLEGEGQVIEDGRKPHDVASGSVIYVPPNQVHQFKNAGEKSFAFLCLVPDHGY